MNRHSLPALDHGYPGWAPRFAEFPFKTRSEAAGGCRSLLGVERTKHEGVALSAVDGTDLGIDFSRARDLAPHEQSRGAKQPRLRHVHPADAAAQARAQP